MLVFIILGIIAGITTFTMTTINSRLRTYVQSPYVSSLISFCIGTILLGAIQLCGGNSLIPTGEQMIATPWWTYIGGFLGMVVMTAYILLFPVIGGVQTVAMPILGQIIMSMLIDNFGWFGANKQPLNIINIMGVIILIMGVLVLVVLPSYAAQRKSKSEKPEKKKQVWIWQLAGIAAGMLLGIQIAVNGNLGSRLQSPLQASFISFGIGAIILAVVVSIQHSWKNIKLIRQQKAPWWVLIGGVFGAVYIFLSAFLAPQIGTGTVVVLALIGQMAASLCVDQFGLLGAVKRRVSVIQIIGLIIMLAGVGMIKIL